MAPFSGVPTHAQQVTLALTPKFAAALSITGSTYIVYDVLRIRKRKKASFQTFQRLMIGLSVFDILMSAGLFTSTWLMPSDTEFVWGARGTTATCSVIGFIEQAGVAAVMYNGSLSILYLLTIQYGWTSTRLQRSVEIWLHLVPILFAVSTMVAGIPLKLYNSGLFDCWIAPFPQSCQQSWRSNGETTCERGDNASLYQWGFDLIPKFSAIVVATVNMILIYIYVRKTELKSLATSLTVRSRGVSESDRIRRGAKLRMASKLAVQSYFYVGALYLTYVPVIITRITELTLGYVYYEMLLIISITIPLQGFWNSLVYLRPRWIEARGERKFGILRTIGSIIRKGASCDEHETPGDDMVQERDPEEERGSGLANQVQPKESLMEPSSRKSLVPFTEAIDADNVLDDGEE